MTDHRYPDEVVEKALAAYWGAAVSATGLVPLAGAVHLGHVGHVGHQTLMAGLRAALDTWNRYGDLDAAAERFYTAAREEHSPQWDQLTIGVRNATARGIEAARDAVLWYNDPEAPKGEEAQHAPGPDGLTPEDFYTTPMPAPPTHTADVHYSGPHGEELTFTIQLPASHDPLTLPNAVALTLNAMLRSTVESAQRVEVVEP